MNFIAKNLIKPRQQYFLNNIQQIIVKNCHPLNQNPIPINGYVRNGKMQPKKTCFHCCRSDHILKNCPFLSQCSSCLSRYENAKSAQKFVHNPENVPGSFECFLRGNTN